jgi:hypothetical protein
MADMGRRQPAVDEPLHPLPLDASLLTPPLENVVPEATDSEAEVGQSIPIARYSEVSDSGAERLFCVNAAVASRECVENAGLG